MSFASKGSRVFAAILFASFAPGQMNVDLSTSAVAGSGQKLYVLSGTNLFRTTDGGSNWRPIYVQPAGKAQGITLLATDPGDPAIVYAYTSIDLGGVWKSADSGDTWTQINTGLPEASAVQQLMPVKTTQLLYARAGQSIYKTADGGAHWTLQAALPTGGSATSPWTVNIAQPTLQYYAALDANQAVVIIHRSTNDAVSWSAVGSLTAGSVGSLTLNSVTSLASDPAHTNVVYATERGPFGQPLNSAFKSSNQGASWTASSVTSSRSGLVDLPGNLFLTGPEYATGHPGGYYRSANQAQTFTEHTVTGGAGEPKLFLDLAQSGAMYASGPNPARSIDAGLTWTVLKGMVKGTLAVPAAGFSLRAAPGGTASTPLQVQFVENSNWASSYTATVENGPWLTVTSSAGATPASIQLKVDATGFTVGTYSANVRLSSPGALNPVTIPVMLTVAESMPAAFTISRVAGGGTSTPEGADPLDADFGFSVQSAMKDSAGRLWMVERHQVYRTNAQGKLERVAGTGVTGFSGDGGPASLAQLASPTYLTFLPNGDAVIGDQYNNRLRRVDAPGNISTLAQYSSNVSGPVADKDGNVYVLNGATLVRHSAAGQSTNVKTGTGASWPHQLALDLQGNVLIADRLRHMIVRIAPDGTQTTVAGTGIAGFSGDGSLATTAQLNNPEGVGMDDVGNLYIADAYNQRVRMVNTQGIIQTIAGTGAVGGAGDGGAALLATLTYPQSIFVEANGDILTTSEDRVRKLHPLKPAIFPKGAVSAASYQEAHSPGSIVAIFGETLATGIQAATSAPWLTTMAGTQATLNGRWMPLHYVSPGLVNAMIPYETELGPARLVVWSNGLPSAEYTMQIKAAAPGIIMYGANRAIAVNLDDGTLNSAENPAKPGSYLVVYLIGLGATDFPVATGAAAPSDRLVHPVGSATLMLGSRDVPPDFLGLTPTAVALAQLNIKIPEDLPDGDYPVKLTVAGQESNAPLIAVKRR